MLTIISTWSKTVGSYPHRMHFVSLMPGDSSLAEGSQSCFSSAVQDFTDQDCKRAVFYLGAMCHYINDVFSYFHLFCGDEIGGTSLLQGHKTSFEKRIQGLTWRIESGRGSTQEFDFFSISDSRNSFISGKKEIGWFAAYKAGLVTDSHKQSLWVI